MIPSLAHKEALYRALGRKELLILQYFTVNTKLQLNKKGIKVFGRSFLVAKL